MAQQSGLVFQHTAARRRLEIMVVIGKVIVMVSTHSRPKAADFATWPLSSIVSVSTHSRPKAAAKLKLRADHVGSFNTQPPEGGCKETEKGLLLEDVSTHSRPKAAGLSMPNSQRQRWFQHTAARRRLLMLTSFSKTYPKFQHTAARRRL